ncbi:uracil-DNA glycosylase [Camelimonas abortus]|uniref:Uracil-DNA glycosylase n=1 Tax=Camelimonas abortus TaxID=1017184 RepID=A0ABV7LEB4_9HYPH
MTDASPAARATPASYQDAVARFMAETADGWADLAFFRSGAAARAAARADARRAAGAVVLPAPGSLLTALRLTPLHAVRAVILGQDPYPTPGDAHGLAFSVRRSGPPPRSLANIFRELTDDLGVPPPAGGDLSGWARQGVLLLNMALTVEAGAAGAHRGWGWEALAAEAVTTLAAGRKPVAFVLWGADARRMAGLARAHDPAGATHLVIESAHPSPLSARRGFFGSRPFSRVNAFLEQAGRGAVDWSRSGDGA